MVRARRIVRVRYAAVILAGGAARRLGGVSKPLLPVGGRPMLDRVLAAVAGADQRIVVGPATLPVPAGVARVSEQPPGGGPVAALAAGLPLVDQPAVALLAADLPFLDQPAVDQLLGALARDEGALAGPAATPSTVDGVVFVDESGRRQTLCGVWWAESLRAALPAEPAGVPLRVLLAGLRIGEISGNAPGPPPWYDCDQPDDLRRAEEWS
jgi:molybdopterin-guanine dinucleotide biosynthesis protein A